MSNGTGSASAAASATLTETEEHRSSQPPVQRYVMRLQNEKKIVWSKDTIDNEHLGRKSSKRKWLLVMVACL